MVGIKVESRADKGRCKPGVHAEGDGVEGGGLGNGFCLIFLEIILFKIFMTILLKK